MRKVAQALCLILLSFHALQAQSTNATDDEEWYLGKPIDDIRFTGLVNVSINDLEGIIAPFIGESFTTPLFWDLQSKLFALDFFEEFTPEAIPAVNNPLLSMVPPPLATIHVKVRPLISLSYWS